MRQASRDFLDWDSLSVIQRLQSLMGRGHLCPPACAARSASPYHIEDSRFALTRTGCPRSDRHPSQLLNTPRFLRARTHTDRDQLDTSQYTPRPLTNSCSDRMSL